MPSSFHPHPYDLTSKALFKDLELPLLRYVTGKNVTLERYLDIQFQTIESQRADLLCEARLDDEPVLIHLELQSDNDPQMLYRMMGYLVDIHQAYQKPVYQCVVYLGKDPVKMQNHLQFKLTEDNHLNYHYRLLALNEVDFSEIARLETVDFLALLPLTRSEWKAEEHLQQSINTLVERSQGLDFHSRSDLLLKTEILAGLRYSRESLTKVFEEVMQMFKLEQSEGYQMILEKGVERGLEKGRQEGIQTGRQEGIQAGRQEVLQEAEDRFRQRIGDILRKRFGPVPLTLTQQLQPLSLAQLDQALANALEAESMAAFLESL